MYCHNCGKSNPQGSNFCHDCGTAFTEPSSVEEAHTAAILTPTADYVSKNSAPYRCVISQHRLVGGSGQLVEEGRGRDASGGTIAEGGLGLQWPQVCALFGAVLLFLGVFAPAFRVTVVFFSVTFDFFNGGHGDGKYLMGLAVLALFVAAFKRYWGVFAVGAISLAIIVIDLVDAMNKWGANSFVVLSYEWGCAVLILGAVLLLAVPLVASMTAQNDSEFSLYAGKFS